MCRYHFKRVSWHLNHLYEDELGAVLLDFEVVVILASFEVLQAYLPFQWNLDLFRTQKNPDCFDVDSAKTIYWNQWLEANLSDWCNPDLQGHQWDAKEWWHLQTFPGETETLRIWTCYQSILRPEAKADNSFYRLQFDIGLLGVEVQDLVHCWGKDTELLLDLYSPGYDPRPTRPTVVLLHGGCWSKDWKRDKHHSRDTVGMFDALVSCRFSC